MVRSKSTERVRASGRQCRDFASGSSWVSINFVNVRFWALTGSLILSLLRPSERPLSRDVLKVSFCVRQSVKPAMFQIGRLVQAEKFDQARPEPRRRIQGVGSPLHDRLAPVVFSLSSSWRP